MSEAIIELKNVSKSFYLRPTRKLKKTVINRIKGTYKKNREDFILDVLDDINLKIEEGERVAILGKNGCGKSTMLRLMANIYKPTSGTIEVSRKPFPLMELGAGFHPDLTGRENITYAGLLLGQKKKTVQEKEEAIIAFSELGKFIDRPVGIYSSGMKMRLAFSVAYELCSDFLIIDEAIAVGDKKFKKKMKKRLEGVIDEGATLVLVTHSMNQAKQFCNRFIFLKDGKIYKDTNDPHGLKKILNEVL